LSAAGLCLGDDLVENVAEIGHAQRLRLGIASNDGVQKIFRVKHCMIPFGGLGRQRYAGYTDQASGKRNDFDAIFSASTRPSEYGGPSD
jgi:hypothetical protein